MVSLTESAPTAGTLTFTLPLLPTGINYIDDMFVSVEAADGSVSGKSVHFSMYTARSLSNVVLSHKLLSKGGSYHVNWTATGEPYPVRLLHLERECVIKLDSVCASFPQSSDMEFAAALSCLQVTAMLYWGNSTRQTVTGQPCVPWTEATGINVTGCIFSYDLVSEVCATAVDEQGECLTRGLKDKQEKVMACGG